MVAVLEVKFRNIMLISIGQPMSMAPQSRTTQ